jgi:hypothetical protein
MAINLCLLIKEDCILLQDLLSKRLKQLFELGAK